MPVSNGAILKNVDYLGHVQRNAMMTFLFADSNVVNRAAICGLSAHAGKVCMAGSATSPQHSDPAKRVDIINPTNCLDKALLKLSLKFKWGNPGSQG